MLKHSPLMRSLLAVSALLSADISANVVAPRGHGKSTAANWFGPEKVSSAPNRRPAGAGMASIRAARKARNQRRHRIACR